MGKRGRKPQDPALKQALVSGSFNTIISMVEEGWNISDAVAKLGIDRNVFYSNITKEQKGLLDIAKTLNTKYGVGSRWVQ